MKNPETGKRKQRGEKKIGRTSSSKTPVELLPTSSMAATKRPLNSTQAQQ